MSADDSMLDFQAMARARALLTRSRPPERTWPALVAAAALAISALAFATAMILAPPLVTHSAVKSAPE